MSNLLPDVHGLFDRPFRELAIILTSQHPEARFSVRSNPVGAATTHQGHRLYVECFWLGRSPDIPDHVLLEVQLCHLSTTPRINADVCWGHGRVEAEFAPNWSSSDDWPVVTPDVLERLAVRMPELIAAFRQAVVRGAPVDDCQ